MLKEGEVRYLYVFIVYNVKHFKIWFLIQCSHCFISITLLAMLCLCGIWKQCHVYRVLRTRQTLSQRCIVPSTIVPRYFFLYRYRGYSLKFVPVTRYRSFFSKVFGIFEAFYSVTPKLFTPSYGVDCRKSCRQPATRNVLLCKSLCARNRRRSVQLKRCGLKEQGRAQEYERGRGRYLKPSVFRPKSSGEQKKVIPQMSSFPPKVKWRAKKSWWASRPQVVFYAYIAFTPGKFCALVCGGGRPQQLPPGYAPEEDVNFWTTLGNMILLVRRRHKAFKSYISMVNWLTNSLTVQSYQYQTCIAWRKSEILCFWYKLKHVLFSTGGWVGSNFD